MSSRTTSVVPSASNSAAPCSPPVLANTFCSARSLVGHRRQRLGADLRRVVAGAVRLISRTASSDALPHTPHDDVV